MARPPGDPGGDGCVSIHGTHRQSQAKFDIGIDILLNAAGTIDGDG
jgi:hypothetical protein